MTATNAHAAGAVDAKSRESPRVAPVPLDDPANDAAQQTGRAPRGKVPRKHSARHRGGSTTTLNELRPGYRRIADIYGLPVNIIRDPLNGKFIAWLGKPGISGATIGPIVETIVPQKPPRGSARGSRPGESNADTRSIGVKSMRGTRGFPPAPVADLH